MNFVRFIHLGAVDVERFVLHFDLVARQSNHALYKWNVSIGWRFESNDVQTPDGPVRQESSDYGWIIRWEDQLIQKEMIADHDRRLHRLGWHLRSLRDVTRKN